MKNSVHIWVRTLKRHGIQEQDDFQAVMSAAGESETAQEMIQDWLELDFSF
jgi:hypothetical protein